MSPTIKHRPFVVNLHTVLNTPFGDFCTDCDWYIFLCKSQTRMSVPRMVAITVGFSGLQSTSRAGNNDRVVVTRGSEMPGKVD